MAMQRNFKTLKSYSSTPNLMVGKGRTKQRDYLAVPVAIRPHMLEAQTICDAIMFPKPRFVAHVISPPMTPELSSGWPLPPTPMNLDKALKDGEVREREREEWAMKAKGSGFSRNLSVMGRHGRFRLLVVGRRISESGSNQGRRGGLRWTLVLDPVSP